LKYWIKNKKHAFVFFGKSFFMTPTLDLQLIDAVRAENINDVKMLLDQGANPNFIVIHYIHYKTPLYWAIVCDNQEIASLLLCQGANPNLVTGNGVTPIHVAIGNDKFEMVILLLDHGADPKLIPRHGVSPLNILISKSAIMGIILPELDDGYPDLVTRTDATPTDAPSESIIKTMILLLAKGADPNALTIGNNTPLHMAVRFNDQVLANLLLDRGANPLCVNSEGFTPAMHARNFGFTVIAAMIDIFVETSNFMLYHKAVENARLAVRGRGTSMHKHRLVSNKQLRMFILGTRLNNHVPSAQRNKNCILMRLPEEVIFMILNFIRLIDVVPYYRHQFHALGMSRMLPGWPTNQENVYRSVDLDKLLICDVLDCA